ncbi:MAG: 30S ribosomal protein S15 [Planctomycetota bacterium]|nr:30S ribosomal protein S15 [Planctomycetota bacterium]
MAVKNPRKAAIIEKFREGESDTGSTRVQIAVLTDRIVHLTEHLKKYKKDYATRRGLLRLVGRRKALLDYYSRKNPSAYRELIQELGIRR